MLTFITGLNMKAVAFEVSAGFPAQILTRVGAVRQVRAPAVGVWAGGGGEDAFPAALLQQDASGPSGLLAGLWTRAGASGAHVALLQRPQFRLRGRWETRSGWAVKTVVFTQKVVKLWDARHAVWRHQHPRLRSRSSLDSFSIVYPQVPA